MKGLSLKTLKVPLHTVGPEHDRYPITSIESVENRFELADVAHTGPLSSFNFITDCINLPLTAFRNFSFDELCKVFFSQETIMHRSVDDAFNKNARFEIIRKIRSSMYRWGFDIGTWNEVVDTYEGIRRFSIGLPRDDFEVRLDYTTGYNEKGYSKFSRTFLDGVFGFLVYYKRTHVMTIGFSFTKGRRLLIQQVQSAKRTGNRYLYHFPKNRLEFIISRFKAAFPSHQIYVINGQDLFERIFSAYQAGLENTRQRLETAKNERFGDNVSNREWHLLRIRELEETCVDGEVRLSHLESEQDRLVAFYADSGSFTLGTEPFRVNGLNHYPVVT